METKTCQAKIWPLGGQRPCGHRARFETIEPEPVYLCGTHANSWRRQHWMIRPIESMEKQK